MDEMKCYDLESVISDPLILWDKIDNSSILITGATGLIGSLLVKTLLLRNSEKNGHIRIFAHARNRKKCDQVFGSNSGLSFIIGDIKDTIALDFEMDYIVHTASVTTSKIMINNPVETLDTSIRGTQNILEFAKKREVKGIVYLSSMEAYGVTSDEQNPITEEKMGYIDLSDVRSCYPAGKRLCELMCNLYHIEYGLPVTIARLAQTFGPGVPENDNRAPVQFAKSVLANQNIILHTEGKSVSNFCYSVDAIRAILMLLTEGGRGESYNVCNDKETRTISEIAELVSSLNEHIKIVYDIPAANKYGYAPDTKMRLNSQKLQQLGWIPKVDMRDAYVRLIGYLGSVDD